MSKNKSIIIARMGILMALSVLLVYLVHFPIIPALPFLEYDPADVPILIGGFAFGPVAGVILTVITACIQGATVSAQSGLYGILMHIVATSVFVLVSALIYKKNKTKKRGAIGLIGGGLAMVAVMVPANLIITPLFTGTPVKAIIGILPLIILFNFIKVTINGIITFLIYKKISNYLHSKI